MKKRTKNEIQARRFYASGIPMQREQKNLFTVKAGTLVNVILVKTVNAICEVKCDKAQKEETGHDSVVVRIPVDNFAGDKIKTPARKNAKEVKPKVKKNKVDGAPVVDTEPAAETPAPDVVETPAAETPATVVEAEPVEAAL